MYTVTPNVTPVFKETPFKDQLDNNLGKSIGLSLQLPIFNGLSTRTNVKRAKLNYEITKLNHELNKKNLYKSVQQAVNDASSSLKKYEAGKHSVDAQNETLNYNQQRIDLGLISGRCNNAPPDEHARDGTVSCGLIPSRRFTKF